MYITQEEQDAKLAQYWAGRYSWAIRKRSDIDLNDLHQAAFLGIMQARKTFDQEKASFVTYASFYARNEIRALLGIRSGKMPPSLLSLDAPLSEDTEDTLLDVVADESIPDPDDALIADDFRQTVRAAVNRLAEDQKAVVSFRFYDGLTYNQTAAEMHLMPVKVVQIYHNAERNLRRDRYLRALADVDRQTRFMHHVGVTQFNTTMTSAVEQIVIWRESKLNKLLKRIEKEEEVDKDSAPVV